MAKIRKRVIKAGKMLEVSYYPVNAYGQRIPECPCKTQKTKEQMAEENKRKAVKKYIRLVNTNFTENDYYVTLTYNQEYAPLTYEQAEKDIQNYIRRLKYARLKKGLSNKKLKYAYSIQVVNYKTGSKQGLCNYHVHMFITAAGMMQNEMKDLWPYGTKGNITNYDPYMFGPEAAAKYMTRSFEGKKMYKCSKNMDKPIIQEEKDGQINDRKLDELGKQRVDDKEYWEKKYPSYNFVRCNAQYNEFNGHWYMTVIMYKKSNKNSYYERARKNAKPNLTYANIRR